MAKQGHVDQRLTDVSIQYKNGEFVAAAFAPEVAVKNGSDLYTTYDKGNMFINKDDTLSKDGEALIVQGGTDTETYSVSDHGLKGFVTSTDRRNADAPLNPEIDTTEMLMQAIMLQREIRTAALFAGLGSNLYATPGTKWTPTAGTPVTDIDNVIAYMFYRPNVMGITQPVWDKIKRNTEVLALIGGGNPAIKMATAQMFMDYFQVQKFFIINNKKNSAKAGNTASLSQVWGNSVAMAYVSPVVGLKSATFAKTFAQRQDNGQTFQVRRWEEQARGVGGSTCIQVEHQSIEKVVCSDLGAMLYTCL